MISRLKHLLRQPELQVCLFLFFLFLFLLPVLRGDGPEEAPASFFYFFAVWGLCITVLFVLTRSLQNPPLDRRDQDLR